MKGDFSRSTFRPDKHYASVRMQQGRIQLDSDWNEQADIQARLVETLTRDLIGPCGGPVGEAGFAIFTDPSSLSDKEGRRLEAAGVLPLRPGDFLLSRGRYYVQGTLCENESVAAYTHQPSLPEQEPLGEGRYLVYLDVWRRHITALEDPEIREVALGGPDTCTRLQTVWQVRALPVPEKTRGTGCSSEIPGWIELTGRDSGRLAARAASRSGSKESDEAEGVGYRGQEDRLYRVEVHDPGLTDAATFKWSRHNGSVVFPVTGIEGNVVSVSDLRGDDRRALSVGDWVEFVDDAYTLTARAEPLVQVVDIDDVALAVTLSAGPSAGIADDPSNHPFLRRWDHADTNGAAGVSPADSGAWIDLEDGVQVRFEDGDARVPFRTGDYWQIPARTANADVEWPDEAGAPAAEGPHGVQHSYCRLGVVASDGRGVKVVEDCRHLFPAATDRARS